MGLILLINYTAAILLAVNGLANMNVTSILAGAVLFMAGGRMQESQE